MDFGGFHRVDLPARIAAGRGALAAADVAPLGPLAIRLAETGETFTYVPTGDTIAIVEGDADARCVVEVDQDSFDGLMLDLDSVSGLLYSGRVSKDRGNPLRFIEWEPGLRA